MKKSTSQEFMLQFVIRGLFHLYGLILISACKRSHMSNSVQREIGYPLRNLNGATAEVWEMISNFIPHFILDVFTYRRWDLS